MEGRILKPVPAELRVKMDELVHDLTQALEETSCSSSVKIKVGFRRRARSAGNVGKFIILGLHLSKWNIVRMYYYSLGKSENNPQRRLYQ